MTENCSGECGRKQCAITGNGTLVGDNATQYNCYSHRPSRSAAQSATVVLLLVSGVLLIGSRETSEPARPVPSVSASASASAAGDPSRGPGAVRAAAPSAPGAVGVSVPRSPATGGSRTPPPEPPSARAPRPPAVREPAPAPVPAPAPTLRKPDPPPKRNCATRQQYRVNKKGQIWDARGHHVGDVAAGTLFFRRETASYPEPVHDRFYGTVDEVISGSATGYVLRRKLDYVGEVEICD
ncbi:hypothetical protein ABZ714_09665 [Streptomyces sp. NPDC006798]|uniref:hypothetical protein n=1 Tax=Streptomyces sp. NPDC006798 TaxID=3155462 RepID=UPI0033C9F5DA